MFIVLFGSRTRHLALLVFLVSAQPAALCVILKHLDHMGTSKLLQQHYNNVQLVVPSPNSHRLGSSIQVCDPASELSPLRGRCTLVLLL